MAPEFPDLQVGCDYRLYSPDSRRSPGSARAARRRAAHPATDGGQDLVSAASSLGWATCRSAPGRIPCAAPRLVRHLAHQRAVRLWTAKLQGPWTSRPGSPVCPPVGRKPFPGLRKVFDQPLQSRNGRGPLHVAERGEQAQRSPALRCHWFAHVNCGNLTDLYTASRYCAPAPAQRRCHQARSRPS